MGAASSIVADMTVPGRGEDWLLIETLRQSWENVPAHVVVVTLRPASAASATCWTLRAFGKKSQRPRCRAQLLLPFLRELGRLLVLRWTATWSRSEIIFLKKETMPTASKRLVCDLLDVAARKLDKVLPRSAVIGVESSQRKSLEAIVTQSIPRDKCLLFVDFATYDEMPLGRAATR